jgi:hypothetical protein
MADDFTIKAGDVLPVLDATLMPADGQTFSLAGATVRLRMWAKSQPADKVNALCTVVDPVARTVRYTWQAGDTDVREGYLAQFLVTFPGGALETFPNGRALVIRVV